MKEAFPICKKDNYIMPRLPSRLKSHSHDELVTYILRKEAEERSVR
jgi:hypothetical protein